MNIEKEILPFDTLEAQRGYQEMAASIFYNKSTVIDERITGYDMTELESNLIDIIKARFDKSFENDFSESETTACFDYQQEQLRQKHIDRIVDEYLIPDNNKPRKRSNNDDDKPVYFNATDIACMILSAVMAIVLTVGYFMI